MLKLASWTPTLSSSKPESTNNDERTEVITKLTEADALPVHQDAAVWAASAGKHIPRDGDGQRRLARQRGGHLEVLRPPPGSEVANNNLWGHEITRKHHEVVLLWATTHAEAGHVAVGVGVPPHVQHAVPLKEAQYNFWRTLITLITLTICPASSPLKRLPWCQTSCFTLESRLPPAEVKPLLSLPGCQAVFW